MLPVTISLGLINFNLLINSTVGFLVSEQRARRRSTRRSGSTCCPQGIFSVAVATVLFPTLARFAARGDFDNLRATMANGMRQIVLLLIPAAAAILVLSEPMIRLVYERGEFGAGRHRAGLDGALLVRVLAPVQRPLPAADAHLLQPPAALGADRDRGRQPRDHGGGRVRVLQAVRDRRDRRRDRDRDRRQRRRPGCVLRGALGRLELGRLAWTTVRVLARLGGAGRGRATRSGTCSTTRSAAAWSARSSRSASRLAVGAVVYGVAITAAADPRGASRICSLLRRGARPSRRTRRAGGGCDAMQASLTDLEIRRRRPAGEQLPARARADDDRALARVRRLPRRRQRVAPPRDRRRDRRRLHVDDLDSRNGTFVNRLRIESHCSRDGDEIQVGRYTLIFRDAEPVEDPAPQARRGASPIASKHV